MKLKILKKKSKEPLANFSCPEETRKAIQAKADLYTDGNFSAWVRYATINMVPPKSDLDPIITKTSKKNKSK